MGSFVHTGAIRLLARRIDRVANSLSETERNAVGKIDHINGEMQGDTIKQIDNKVGQLGEELRMICNDLNACADQLYRYARALELADQNSQKIIGTK